MITYALMQAMHRQPQNRMPPALF